VAQLQCPIGVFLCLDSSPDRCVVLPVMFVPLRYYIRTGTGSIAKYVHIYQMISLPGNMCNNVILLVTNETASDHQTPDAIAMILHVQLTRNILKMSMYEHACWQNSDVS